MRQITFRGQSIENMDNWIYGNLIVDTMTANRASIIDWADMSESNKGGGAYVWNDVMIDTIGQFTGLKDKNGKDIYEGDILFCHEFDSSDCVHCVIQTFENAVVGFGQGNFYYHPKGNMNQPHQLLMYAYQPEIISNIYENPELLNK